MLPKTPPTISPIRIRQNLAHSVDFTNSSDVYLYLDLPRLLRLARFGATYSGASLWAWFGHPYFGFGGKTYDGMGQQVQNAIANHAFSW